MATPNTDNTESNIPGWQRHSIAFLLDPFMYTAFTAATVAKTVHDWKYADDSDNAG